MRDFSSLTARSLHMEFARRGAENRPPNARQDFSPPLNAGVISPEPLKACVMNLQGYYLSVRVLKCTTCVWAPASVSVCVCARVLLRM